MELTADDKSDKREAKIYRQFSQNRPFDSTNQKKGTLSKDILAGVRFSLRYVICLSDYAPLMHHNGLMLQVFSNSSS